MHSNIPLEIQEKSSRLDIYERTSELFNSSQEYINTSNMRFTVAKECSKMDVRAGGFLIKDSSTKIISVNNLLNKNSLMSLIHQVDIVDVRGRLFSTDVRVDTASWLKAVSLATDFHSCNVMLSQVCDGIILRVVKNISPGEPLLMWFTGHILNMLNIQFLMLANIQADNCYRCHICKKIFEFPNPLKLHIALKCDQLDQDYIWTCIANSIKTWRTDSVYELSNTLQTAFTFALTPPISIPSTSQNSPIIHHINTPLTNGPLNLSNQQPTNSLDQSLICLKPQNQMVVKNVLYNHSAFKAYSQQQDPNALQCNIRSDNPSEIFNEHEAQMENLVSNMGKSAEGHICMYCSKVYTRKYGLKIHLRTHTGYKPLKCGYCKRAFGDPSNLNKHIKLHNHNDSSYKCHICDKVMVRRRDLERHLNAKHKENTENVPGKSADE